MFRELFQRLNGQKSKSLFFVYNYWNDQFTSFDQHNFPASLALAVRVGLYSVLGGPFHWSQLTSMVCFPSCISMYISQNPRIRDFLIDNEKNTTCVRWTPFGCWLSLFYAWDSVELVCLVVSTRRWCPVKENLDGQDYIRHQSDVKSATRLPFLAPSFFGTAFNILIWGWVNTY